MQKIRVLKVAPADEGLVYTRERTGSSLAFDMGMAILTVWLIGGAYLDGWAHIHIPNLETFFTPWHAVLYSGYLASALLLFGAVARNMMNGYPFAKAIPAGYGLSTLGVAAFAFGAMSDLIWHAIFGIEASVEALLSPTHLILAASSSLIVLGPLLAAWSRPGRQTARAGLGAFLPVVLSMTAFYSILTFFTEYASPFGETLAGLNRIPGTGDQTLRYQELGVADFLLQAAILTGLVLFVLRRWKLPWGSFTVMITLNTGAMAWMHDGWFSTGTWAIIGVGLLAGLSCDVLYQRLMPSIAHPTSLHWFAFLTPIVLYTLYYLALFLFGGGVWWSVHMWAGSILMSGIVGLLMSYAILPAPVPD